MPLPMVHLAVAYALKDSPLAGSDKAAFFLGVNAPDAVQKREDWTLRDKMHSHLMINLPEEKKREIQTERVRALWYKRTGDPTADSFLAGYCVHLLTDILWKKDFYQPIFTAAFKGDHAPGHSETSAYHNDSSMADLELYKTAPWRAEVFALLAGHGGYTLESLVYASEVNLWTDHILHSFDDLDLSHYRPMRYFTTDQVLAFAEQAAEKICKFL